MDLFDKCRTFDAMIQHVRSRNQFYYLREVNPAAAPVVTRNGRRMIMLGSNNYLGLTEHPKMKEAAIAAIRELGTGCAGSRVLTGTTHYHTEMEALLAKFKGCEACVTFSAGFMAMLGTIAGITAKGEYVLSDELNHASIIDGCRLSQAEIRVYRHSDMGDLEELLAGLPADAPKLVVTDGVFSMKGDICRLPDIVRLAGKYRARVMVDDAHATGVLGRTGKGTAEHFDLEGKVDMVSGTFSKAFGALGGFTCTRREVVTFLQLNSRAHIFAAALPPSVAATVKTGIELLMEHPDLVAQVRENARFMKQGLEEMGYSIEFYDTPIIPVAIPDDAKAFMMAGALEQEGIFANPVVPPAVPSGQSIIRISLMATHTREHLTEALEKFGIVGKRVGVI